MAQAIRKKRDRKTIPVEFSILLREGILIVSLALATLVVLALATHVNTDPGWSYSGHSNRIHNIGGRFGAWLSDCLLYLFGYVAYCVPLFILWSGWSVSQGKTHLTHVYTWPHKGLGGLFVLLSSATLGHLYLFATGGVLGKTLSQFLTHYFNPEGATIVLIAVFLVGTTLISHSSWLKLVDAIGSLALHSFSYLKRLKPKSKTEITPIEPFLQIDAAPIQTPSQNKPVRTTKEKTQTELSSKHEKTKGLPALALLDLPEKKPITQQGISLETLGKQVELKLKDFGIEAYVAAIHPGPVVTRFELQLAPGIKASKVTSLSRDLARSLMVVSVRVAEVIPGKSVIGLELPNQTREIVRLREILESPEYQNSKTSLTLALGKDIAGFPFVVDLTRMPHLLVAGTTGSGKSVGINAMLLNLLYKATPEQVRMILIDPKMLELSIYEGIPHLLTPVVTDMKDAANALRWCVAEMDRRYHLMATLGVRNIAGYNERVKQQPLPFIVVVIDELADMMMVVGKKVDLLIARIAQKARAAGIHLIVATQRPSVDVITGLIKANIPTRIAYQVSSRIDSRTILDQQGAEHLLGHGDMLYLAPGAGIPTRIHGAFVADHEVHKVVEALKQQGEPQYQDEILGCTLGEGFESAAPYASTEEALLGESDALYDQAVYIVTETRRASVSLIQRRLKIGYNRAARIVEDMEKAGVVGLMQSNGAREVLAPAPVLRS